MNMTSLPLALRSLTDIKRLAEKEDWVVDNEGLTSLVGVLMCLGGPFWIFFFFLQL